VWWQVIHVAGIGLAEPLLLVRLLAAKWLGRMLLLLLLLLLMLMLLLFWVCAC